MGLSKYEIFNKVIQLGSLTAAAKALGCTQSAVSHAINALEAEAGLTLIIRNRSGVKLTPDGLQLLPALQGIGQALSAYEETLNQIHGLEQGQVNIGAFTSVAVHWLPGMIKTYQVKHPKTEIRLQNGDYHDIAQWFEKGNIDIGFVTEKTNLPGYAYLPLKEDPLLIVLPKNHPLAGHEEIPVQALAGEPFISLLETSDQDARGVLEQAGVWVDVKFTTKDDYAIIAMVEQGLGISIMPELLLAGRCEGLALARITGGKSRTIGLAISPAGQKSPSAKSFADHVVQWIKERYRPED